MGFISNLFGTGKKPQKGKPEVEATEEKTVQVTNEHEGETHGEQKPQKKEPKLDAENDSAKCEGKTSEAEQHVAAKAGNGDRPEQSDITDIYHLIVLDESGSMFPVEKQTVSGCNETIQTIRLMQQKTLQTQRHFVSIYLFDSANSRYIFKNATIDSVRDITKGDYRPNSLTPLYDALGHTLTELRQTIESKSSLAYVTIITDGYENASREYSLGSVRALIDEMKRKDTVFSFIGANIEVDDYAESLGIDNRMQFDEDEEGTQEMWRRERRSKMRSNAKYSVCCRRVRNVDFIAEENLGNYYAENTDISRVSPRVITSLADNEVFVFGSNTAGRHLGGAAALALAKFGAKMGQCEGLQGQSYAIVTDGTDKHGMYDSISRFCEFARNHPELTFLVTAVGCGSAGYDPYNVAPAFAECVGLSNVKLPEAFWEYL